MTKSSWFLRASIVGGLALALGLPTLAIDPSYADETVGIGDSTATGEDLAAATDVVIAPEITETSSTFEVATAAAAVGEDFDEDPWEGFNEKMFWFNKEVLDRFLLKPAATAWDFILPDMVQRSFHNFFDNLAVVRRVVNNGLQAKPVGAFTELARFTINSTIGLAGFFDVAKDAFGIEQ